jgi:hypothetical protein
MKKIVIVLTLLLTANVSYSDSGAKTCQDKKMFLRDICKSQKLNGETAIFNQCANGYTYEISTDGKNVDPQFVTTDIQCKMVEIRMQDGIESRTAYFDATNNKVVVYQHDNGLSNAYVYGSTGYYHVTKFASGDSIFNFHSFDN